METKESEFLKKETFNHTNRESIKHKLDDL